MVIQIINNINLGAGTQGFGAGPQSRPAPLAPRAMRIAKEKKEGKKEKKAAMKTITGVVSFPPWSSSMLKSGLMCFSL